MSARAADLYEPRHRALIRATFARLRRRLSVAGGTLSANTRTWMHELAGGAPAASYYTHPDAFPMLLLPWWLERSIRRAPDLAFQADVAYSTICGYYFVRMIDDLMDRDRETPPAVLPAMTLFHTEFQRTYGEYFDHGHAFWNDLAAISFESAEAASKDAANTRIDRARFLAVSSRKVAGAKIPLAAVCHHYRRTDLLRAWSRTVDLFGRWHQMWNDMFGWRRDLEAGRATYFLSEGAKQSADSGRIGAWVLSDGLTWGAFELRRWMREIIDGAGDLGCPSLVAYLERRQSRVDDVMKEFAADLARLGR